MDFKQFVNYCNEVIDGAPEEELVLVNSDETINNLIYSKIMTKCDEDKNTSIIPNSYFLVNFLL